MFQAKDVIQRNDPPRRLVAVSHKGPYPEIGAAFDRLYGALGAQGLIEKSGHPVGIYYDNRAEVAAEDLRSHAAAELAAGGAAPLEVVTLAGGRMAVLTFRGAYDGLHRAWDWIYLHWLPQSGERPALAPPFEIYLNTPMDTAPEDLLTEICIPLA